MVTPPSLRPFQINTPTAPKSPFLLCISFIEIILVNQAIVLVYNLMIFTLNPIEGFIHLPSLFSFLWSLCFMSLSIVFYGILKPLTNVNFFFDPLLQASLMGTTTLSSLIIFPTVFHTINIKLDSSNYFFWLVQLLSILSSYQLTAFIDGSSECPT